MAEDPLDPARLPTCHYDEAAINRARELLDAVPESVGPYRILEPLGGGGMGEVYRAEQRSPIRRQVAIKIIKLGMDTKAVIARFEAERQALALMDHPHIAKVFDAGAEPTGRPYFVMEYVKGKEITKYADLNHLTIIDRLELFEQVCQAVQHAHHKGIIHRDLKPGNVLVSTHDGKPFAKVIDFGIAKAVSQQLTDKTLFTRHDEFIGTPQYMSPEQAEGCLDIDTRTDVYSLGAMLYELLAGSPPFTMEGLRAAAFEQIKRMIVEDDPLTPSARLSQSLPTLPTLAAFRRTEPRRLGALVQGELDWIVMKALEKDRNRRYETPATLALDISAYLKGEPINAAPPGARYRLLKFLKKYRTQAISATAVTAALAVGLTGAGWGYFRTVHLEDRERLAQRETELARKEESRQRDAAEFFRYTSNLMLAQHAIAGEDWEEARRLLGDCPEHLRGWEWSFLFRRATSIIFSTSDYLNQTAFSPTGNHILATQTDRTIRIFTTTGKQAVAPLRHDTDVTNAQFSPDGMLILSVSDDGTARLWSTNGVPVGTQMRHPEKVQMALFNSTTNRILTCSANVARLWSRDGQAIGEPVIHDHPVTWAAFSPDGRQALTISNEDTSRLWRSESGPIGQPLRHEGRVEAAVFSPNGVRILVRADARTLYVCADDGSRIGTPLAHRADLQPVVSWRRTQHAAFSEDGSRILTCDADDHAWLWTGDGQLLSGAINHENSAFNPIFSPDGRRFITASSIDSAQLWSSDGTKIGSPVFHGGRIGNAKFSASGEFVLAGANSISLWTANSGIIGRAFVSSLSESDYYELPAIKFSPDGTMLALESFDATRVQVIDSTSPSSPISTFNTDNFKAEIACADEDGQRRDTATWKSDRDFDASIGLDGRLKVVHRMSGVADELASRRSESIQALAVHPDRTRMALLSSRSIRFVETNGWRDIAVFPLDSPPMPGLEVTDLWFTDQGGSLVLKRENGDYEVWDSRGAEEQKRSWSRRAAEEAPAAEYTAALLSSPVKLDLLRAHVQNDHSLNAVRKSLINARLVRELDSLQNDAARRLQTLKMDVLALKPSIKDSLLELFSPHESQRFNEIFRRLVAEWTPTSDELNLASWKVVQNDRRTLSEYANALATIRKAVDQGPKNADMLNTLGVAYYRAQEYQRAIEVLTESERALARNKTYSTNQIFIAMASFQLGRTDEAQQQLKELRERATEGKEFSKDDIEFLKEAEKLISALPADQVRK